MQIPRIVLAGTQSGVGKTTLAVGLMAALKRRGYQIQPYKVGPDYIDPGFHTLATGRRSRNLDNFFLGEEGLLRLFLQTGQKADLAIIEGVMGLFDGKGRTGESSTAQVAKIVKAPVILIIDGQKMAQSAAAMAYGYKNFDRELLVSGVIINNLASENHYQLIKYPLETKAGVKVLGYLPAQSELKLPERHLGLVPIAESEELGVYLEQLVSAIEQHIDLEQLMEIAIHAPELDLPAPTNNHNLLLPKQQFSVKIGVAYDQAFNFYYQYNLELLKEMGAVLKTFSPIKDRKLPDVDGLYLGGGFPESFLVQLATNNWLKKDIARAIKAGLPTYAECGGLLYLCQELSDLNGNCFSMVGVVPARAVMTSRLQGMGYVRVEAIRDNILFQQGNVARGHQFHYSRLDGLADDRPAYRLERGRGEGVRTGGYVRGNLLASYVHLHFGSNPFLAQRFIEQCSR